MEGQSVAEDECNIGDSLCTSGVLDNLQEIEAWEKHPSAQLIPHPFPITTSKEHPVGVPRDQSCILNISGLRRSPRIQMLQLNTRKHDVRLGGNAVGGSKEDVKIDKNEQNSDLLTSVGIDTLEAIDAMDLDDSIFHKVPVSQLRKEEFGNQSKTKCENGTSHQPSYQSQRRSQHQKSKNGKDECTKELICSRRSRKDAVKHNSEITPIHLTKYESEQDGDLGENKKSSAKEERHIEVEYNSKILKDLTTHSKESSIDQNHRQQEETSGKKNSAEETKIYKEQCLKSPGKTTWITGHNKENLQNFNGSHKKAISKSRKPLCDGPTEAKSLEASLGSLQKGFSLSSPQKQPIPVSELALHQYSPGSPGTCSKKPVFSVLRSSALCAQTHSLHYENIVSVNPQQCTSNQNSEKKLDCKILVDEIMGKKQDNISDSLYTPENGRKTFASKDSIIKMENTVLKSPLSGDDSQSFLSTPKKMELSAWGLPETVLKCYLENGVKKMFPWQAECLSLPGVLEGRNLVYSAPTSAGKTLVAELLLLKRVLEGGRKGIFILPFVSVAREKMHYLQKMFGSVGVRVEGFMGSQGPPGGLKTTDIAVCTIEKANNLINRLLEDRRVSELGMVVVDELHMLGDSHRGYLLELLLTKLTYVTSSMSSTVPCHSPKDKEGKKVQIIGMSATLPNLELLAGWLDAALYTTDFRPVPLQECVKLGTSVYDSSFKKLRDLNPQMILRGDRDHLMQLCLETVLDGFSVLVFCPSKAWCENLAEAVAKEFYEIGKTKGSYPPELGLKLRSVLDSAGIRNVLEALRKCPVGLDKILARSVAFGAAYHHAGLTFDERDIIEGGFRSGSLRVLLATSTLSSGVNLPARRVIIRSPMFGGSLLDALTYKQMVGRAGRKGVDMEGESILICREGEKEKAQTLLTSNLPPITSCLQKDASLTSSMKRAILEVIVSEVARTPQEVEDYCSYTLLAASLRANQQEGKEGTHQNHAQGSLKSCVNFLIENEFIRLQGGEEEEEGNIQYVGSQLGLAVLASGLSPDEGLHVFAELHRARKCFVLENELHIVYQVTPVYVSSAWPELDWMTFLRVWEALSEDQKRVAQLVGVEESFIVRALKGVINRRVRRQAQQLAVHQRFFASLALQDLVQEVPLDEVACKFGASRGVLQALQQSAATFAGMVTVFCNRLGWHNLELLVAQFRERLHFGVQRDLCDLVRLSPLLNAQRARHLHSAGLETVAMVASATCAQVEEILHAATPFHSTKLSERASQGTIWLSSGCCVTEAEAAALIVAEARQLVQKELGISSIDWERRMQGHTNPDKTYHTPGLYPRTPQMVRRELVTPLMGMETPHTGETLLRRQQAASLCTVIERASVKDPKLNGNRKGLSKNSGKKRKSSNHVRSKTVKEDLCSHQTNNEEHLHSAIRQETTQPTQGDKKSLDNPTISAEGVSTFDNKNSTEKSSKYHELQMEAANAVISNTENKSCDNIIMDCRNVDSSSKLSIIDGRKSGTSDRLMNEGRNFPDSKVISEMKNTKTTASSTHLLFSIVKPTKNVEAQSGKSMKALIPESQEDKSDNVFSPKQKPVRSSSTCISKNKGENFTSSSTSHIDGENRSIKTKTSKNLEGPNMPDSKENSLIQGLDAGSGAAAAVADGIVVNVSSCEDGNMSLPHSPFVSGRIKITASSTPIVVPVPQSNKPLAPILTPGSELAASSVLNFMVNTEFNDSSDLFNESDTQDFLGNNTNSQEISRNFEGMQAKKTDTDSVAVCILDQKKEQCKIESQEFLQNCSKLISNIKELGSTNDHFNFKDIINSEDKMCLKLTQSPHKNAGVIMDSQKNVLLMTMNSQKSDDCRTLSSSSHKKLDNKQERKDSNHDCLRSPQSCHKKLDNKREGEDDDLDCPKSPVDCHKELGNEKKGNNDITIDSGVNIKYTLENFKEQCDEDESLGIGEKRKLHLDAEFHVPTKRLCVTHQKSQNHLNCKTGTVRESISHGTYKTDYLSDPTGLPRETDEDFESLSYLEKLTFSDDLYLSEDKVDVEERRNVDNKLADISNQEDLLNQALQNLSELSHKSNNSFLKIEELPNRGNSFENMKETISASKEFDTDAHNDDYVSDSFLEEAFRSCLQSQHADEAEVGSSNQLSQDDLGSHHNIMKPPLGQNIQLSLWEQSCPDHAKHQNKNNKKWVNEAGIKLVQDTRDLQDCTAAQRIPHNKEEIAGKCGINSILHSHKTQHDITFTQLEITPGTEAVLEGKSFSNNSREGRLSGDLFLSPPTETQIRQRNEVLESESTDKSENLILGNFGSLSERLIMPIDTASSMLHKKTTTNTEEDKTCRIYTVGDSKNVVNERITQKSSDHCTSLSMVKEPYLHQNAQQKAETTSQLSSSASNSIICTSSLCIVDVVNDRQVFSSFLEELKQQSVVSLALACELAPSQKQQQEQCIGWRITGHGRTPRKRVQCKAGQQVAGVLVENSDLMVVGLAVCWGHHDAYYLNLRTSQDEPTSCSLPTPGLTDAVPLEERVTAVKNFFSIGGQSVIRMWDAKNSIRLLVGSGLGCVTGPVEDPRVAAWMLDPGAKEPNLCNLVMNHHLTSLPLLEGVVGSRGLGGLGTTTTNPGSCRVRAAVESVVVFHLTPSLISKLKEVEMLQSFVEVEMRSVVELAYMELNGLGFSNKECETQKCIMQAKLSSLEKEAHLLGGHSFNLTSPVEISKVLYGELHLPNFSSRGSCFAPNTRRRGRGRGTGPTNKEALEKLKPHHPLPEIILQWRKIYSALTKVVFPLQKVRLRCSQLAMDRIYPVTHTFTSTGRITMHEPSLQTIPRDFDIQVTAKDTSKSTKKKCLPQHLQFCSGTMTQLAPFLAPASEQQKQQQHTVSLRHALVARSGYVLLAADYSQLELRLLAHLADDQPLLQLLNSGRDVFTLLATHLSFQPTEITRAPSQPTEITLAQRQQAKQVCYGMIYGMGSRALGDQLGVEEEEACILLEQFRNSFPGLQKFATTTVETARHTGYVTTLLGRRRYLPAINSSCSQARAQSECQAVNTAIQGSAADLVKLAMVQIQVALRETFPTAPTSLTTSMLSDCQGVSRGAHLVLHLHDELMYEVMSEDVIQVAQLVRTHMERVLQLSVTLPVKIKVGPSWGSMQTLNL